MTARECALKALYDIDVNGAYVNAALNSALKGEELSSADKAFVTELIYGIVSNKTALDFIISKFSKIKMKKLSPWVLNILRLGIFQMYYMDKIPHSAACNESVKLANRYSHRSGSGFVNGVLRSFSREAELFEFPVSGDKVADLSLIYSYPQWITQKIADVYGYDVCEELYKENQKAHHVAVRVNTLKTDTEKLINILANEGISAEKVSGLENALIIKSGINIEKSDAYKKGLYSLQNISSQLAVDILEPKPCDTVIDMCAAPGGKTCAAAEKMKNCGKIYAFDIFDHKIDLIRATAARLGIDIIEGKVADSQALQKELIGKADKVIADVPCSGLGVMHKKPDIKWHRKEEDISTLAEIQRNILETASKYVKDGGALMYCTCTILPEENSQNTEWFLREHPEFKKVYEKQILTTELGESGFYICKMLNIKEVDGCKTMK